eukprot:scaffold267773_cov26-Tisochrysis_lutea.AAC.1
MSRTGRGTAGTSTPMTFIAFQKTLCANWDNRPCVVDAQLCKIFVAGGRVMSTYLYGAAYIQPHHRTYILRYRSSKCPFGAPLRRSENVNPIKVPSEEEGKPLRFELDADGNQ